MVEVLIRGMSKPFEELLTSSMADASAEEDVLLIATFWACKTLKLKKKQIDSNQGKIIFILTEFKTFNTDF
jgi:hypothetical protein